MRIATVPQLDDQTAADVRRLADRVAAEDGAPPLSDQALSQLRSVSVDHLVASGGDGERVVGYAQRAGGQAELVGEPAALADLLTAVSTPHLLIWSHGRRSRLSPLCADRGYTRVRELYHLRRDLGTLPAPAPLPDGVHIRRFEPGHDDAAWLRVNHDAFATHPEQGGWTQRDLDARKAEPWFDPEGFLLAERDGALLGFHWTKIHPDGLGEVYVLGVSPAAQGLGLGRSLLDGGLAYLAERGCRAVLLYVDGDNETALKLYERSGFTRYDLDIQWRERSEDGHSEK